VKATKKASDSLIWGTGTFEIPLLLKKENLVNINKDQMPRDFCLKEKGRSRLTVWGLGRAGGKRGKNLHVNCFWLV
jgi:hypothetical protein